mmetsp:Transcript_17420/g.39337  ORF Transcript_17420/g.39337 Transcript_17420/m.39337 type:complete len:324 (-) Transcript_17420:1133-2104(-)
MRLIVTDSRPEPSQREGGADHEGEPDLLSMSVTLVDRGGGVTLRNLFIDLVELVRENLSIFRIDDRVDLRSENLQIVFIERSREVHLHGAIEGGLPSHGDHDAVGFFTFDDLLDETGRDGEEKDVVGLGFGFIVHVGLHRGDVGIHEDHLHTFFFQSLDGLSSRIVEFAGLSDGGSAGAQKQDLFHVWFGRRYFSPGEFDAGRRFATGVEKSVEEELGVGGTVGSFWMELGGHVGTRGVDNTLVSSVIQVGEERLPVFGEGCTIDGISMILRSDVRLSCDIIDDWLILSTITKGQLHRLSPCRQSHELISQTNTKDGLHFSLA